MSSYLTGAVLSLMVLTTCKKLNDHKAPPKMNDQLATIAAFELLEELESEDSFVGSELSTRSVEDDIEWRTQALTLQVDQNANKAVDGTEGQAVRQLIKDKMLEKFDVDSDGLFNQFEGELIKEKIFARLGEFRGRHPEDFEHKKEFICKIVRERNETFAEKLSTRPLFAAVVEKCLRF